jgi:hypothetical protein
LGSWKEADLFRRQPGSLNLSRGRQVKMQGVAFDSPISGSSIPQFSRTEKKKPTQFSPSSNSLFPDPRRLIPDL